MIAGDPSAVQVSGPAAAAETTSAAMAQLTAFGRELMLLILGAGAFLVAVVVLADVLIRRRDLGRRRTLGITRGDLVLLVALRTAVAATAGALLGAGLAYLWLLREGVGVPADFVGAVALLAGLTAVIACILPAAFAAARDPVEVMRTP